MFGCIHSDMKNFIIMSSIIAAIISACVCSDIIIAGCKAGISLWYSAVIPVTLPFMLLTGLVISSIEKTRISTLSAYITILTVGLLCGFPTGTIIISAFKDKGFISEQSAQLLLPLCNNVSAMFLYGYIYRDGLSASISFTALLFMLYIPQISLTLLHALFLRMILQPQRDPSANPRIISSQTAAAFPGIQRSDDECPESSMPDIIEKSIHNITVIGVYMVIFSIAAQALLSFIPGSHAVIPAAFMEISQGISMLGQTNLPVDIRTALILSLTAFGGLSAIFQSFGIIRESGLSFLKYIIGKCVCGTMCLICSYVYMTL